MNAITAFTANFDDGKVFYTPCTSCPPEDGIFPGYNCKGHAYTPSIGFGMPLPGVTIVATKCPTCGK